MFKRTIALTATAVTSAAVVLSKSAPAHAAVSAKNLPTASQVQSVTKAKTTRTTIKANTLGAFKGCKETAGVKARSGLGALYSGSKMSVVTSVVEAKTLNQAKSALNGFTKASKKCRKLTTSGITSTSKRIAVPAVGTQRAGVRLDIMGMKSDLVMVRKGKKVVGVTVSWIGKDSAAKRNKLVKMAVKKA